MAHARIIRVGPKGGHERHDGVGGESGFSPRRELSDVAEGGKKDLADANVLRV